MPVRLISHSAVLHAAGRWGAAVGGKTHNGDPATASEGDGQHPQIGLQPRLIVRREDGESSSVHKCTQTNNHRPHRSSSPEYIHAGTAAPATLWGKAHKARYYTRPDRRATQKPAHQLASFIRLSHPLLRTCECAFIATSTGRVGYTYNGIHIPVERGCKLWWRLSPRHCSKLSDGMTDCAWGVAFVRRVNLYIHM